MEWKNLDTWRKVCKLAVGVGRRILDYSIHLEKMPKCSFRQLSWAWKIVRGSPAGKWEVSCAEESTVN